MVGGGDGDGGCRKERGVMSVFALVWPWILEEAANIEVMSEFR